MIGFLRGTIIERQPTRVLIDVHGVGYDVHIPLSTYEQIRAGDTQVSLQTYLHVREDVLQLYGFATLAEKKLFLQLIAVSGIGPKVALGILSGCTVDEFYQAVHRGEIARLKALPGIGRKTAERLILELKDKLDLQKMEGLELQSVPKTAMSEEALLALVSLGYNRGQAEKVIVQLLSSAEFQDVESLIKQALQRL